MKIAEKLTKQLNSIKYKKMTKTQILEYLSLAPEELDLLKFVQWLELYSEGTFYVEKGKRPTFKNRFNLETRSKK